MSRLIVLGLFLAFIIAPISSAKAEPRSGWQTVLVTLNGYQDLQNLENSRVLRVSAWEGRFSGQRFAQVGECLDRECSWVSGYTLSNSGIYAAGEAVEGVSFCLTYDDSGLLLGGTLSYDSDRFRLK